MQSPSVIVSQAHLAGESSYAVGHNGEALAAGLLALAGYHVEPNALHTKCGDLHVVDQTTGEGWNVEVKTAKRGQDGNGRFGLSKNDRHGKTDCQHSDVVLLLAVLKSGAAVAFVIPSSALVGTQSLTVTVHPESYAGRWAKYRQRGPLSIPAAFELAALAGDYE